MVFDIFRAMAPLDKPTSDQWYNKLILSVWGTNLPFEVGQKVIVSTARYNGEYEIGYIYKGIGSKGTYYNLYFKVPFTGDTTGTINTDVSVAASSTVSSNTNTDSVNEPSSNTTTNNGASGVTTPVSRTSDSQTPTSVTDTVTETATVVTSGIQTALTGSNKYLIYGVLVLGAIVLFKSFKK